MAAIQYVLILMVLAGNKLYGEESMGSKKAEHDVNTSDILVVIRNMHDKTSVIKAEAIKRSLKQSAEKINTGDIEVLMMHEDWAPFGSWTILPILEKLYTGNKDTKKWVFFCEDTTQIHLKGLIRVLNRFDPQQDWLLGHGLVDHEPAIIHHYAFHSNLAAFKFPDFDAGWVLSMPLLKKAVTSLSEDAPRTGFSIDVKHEVAKFLYKRCNSSLTDIREFCINIPLKRQSCVTTVQYEEPNCGEVDADDILVAVKTCKKFHEDRIPVVKQTMGKYAKHIRYYSDVIDKDIPTEYIDVENTERGHCQKLHNIIQRATADEWKDKKWLVVIDDDTIMSFPRLRKLLACYDSRETIVLGERYGYGLTYRNVGYEYPTGGSGMILSRAAINKVFERNCRCSSADSPDDMWLGSCFRHVTPMVHSNSLHQTKPSQYNRDFLSHRYLVSFHKHSNVDPMQIYRDYLHGSIESDTTNANIKNTEL